MGYGHFPDQIKKLAVPPVTEDGVDIDAAALLGGAIRRAVTRHPSADLVSVPKADARLQITLLDVSGSLAPMADPGLRAAQYRARVTMKAVLIHRDGRTLWRTSRIIGQADYLSVPDDIEALEGRHKTALKEASDSAAEQLMTALVYQR